MTYLQTRENYHKQLELQPNAQMPAILTQNDGNGPNIPEGLPEIGFKNPFIAPIILQDDRQTLIPQNIKPLPLLVHALLPLGALLHSVSQRTEELQGQELKIFPSALGIIGETYTTQPTQQQQQQQQQPSTSPIGEIFGLGAGSNPILGSFGLGGESQSQQTQQTEDFLVLDAREIYIRRVLQVIGELHSILTMEDSHEFLFGNKRDPKNYKNEKIKKEIAQSVTPVVKSPITNTANDILSALDEFDRDDDGPEQNQVDTIDVRLHPWHYPIENVSELLQTDGYELHNNVLCVRDGGEWVPVPYDTEMSIIDLENRCEEIPFFREVWKDIKILLAHTGTLLNEQSLKAFQLPVDNNNYQPEGEKIENKIDVFNTAQKNTNLPLTKNHTFLNTNYYTPNLLTERPSNTLVLTKRLSQLYDTLLPSLELAQAQQQSQLSMLQKNGAFQPNQPQPNTANMLLIPQSLAFQLTVSNYHRKYVLDGLIKTIAGSVGTEKQGGNFMDFFGLNFGDEEIGMLQSLLTGGGNGTGGIGGGGPGGSGIDGDVLSGSNADLMSSLLGGSGLFGTGNESSDNELRKLLADLDGGDGGANGGNLISPNGSGALLGPSGGNQMTGAGGNMQTEEGLLMSLLGGFEPTPKPKKGTKKTGKGTTATTGTKGKAAGNGAGKKKNP
jgi:hypothetical protein